MFRMLDAYDNAIYSDDNGALLGQLSMCLSESNTQRMSRASK